MNADEQVTILSHGVEEILPEGGLLERLQRCEGERRPLRVKQGFDPTAPDIHLGHAVGLRKLRQFQNLGHQVVLIVGDSTGMVGDPSGRSKTRPQLSAAEVTAHAETYLERDDFARRYEAQQPIGIHELLYPLMQGYDSVAIRADLELGATEQKFNLLVGRTLQEIHGQPPQVVMTLPVLPGLDGVQRMSKSLGNTIGVIDPPAEIYGKVMSLPDSVIALYWRMVTDADGAELDRVTRELAGPSVNPMTVKKRLGHRLVRMYHGADAAQRAEHDFEAQFSRRQAPDTLPSWSPASGAELGIKDLLVKSGLAKSGSEAWRAVDQGAVSIDGVKVRDRNYRHTVTSSFVLRLGRRMVRVEPPGAGSTPGRVSGRGR